MYLLPFTVTLAQSTNYDLPEMYIKLVDWINKLIEKARK